jgi:hypothetical protein
MAGARQIDRLCMPAPDGYSGLAGEGAFKNVSGKAMFQRHTNIIRGIGVRRAGPGLP